MIFKVTQIAPEVIFAKPEVTFFLTGSGIFITANDICGFEGNFCVTGSEFYGSGNDLKCKNRHFLILSKLLFFKVNFVL